MKSYRNTVQEWAEYFTLLAEQGHGSDLLACAFWTKEDVEESVSMHGYRVELSPAEWETIAHKTEDAWSAFEEEDLNQIVQDLDLEYEGGK
jgi:hypothetical protein